MLEELYKERLEKLSWREGLFAPMQEMAWRKAWEIGLPKKRGEAFEHLPLKRLFSWEFHKTKGKKGEGAPTFLTKEGIEISLWEGDLDSIRGHKEAKIVAMSLKEAQGPYASFYQNRLLQTIQTEKDPFALISLGLQEEGLFLYVPPKTKVEVPIEIVSRYGKGNYYPMPKILLFVGKEAKVEFLYRSESTSEEHKGVHELIDLVVDANAEVAFTSLAFHPEEAMLMHHLRASLKRGSKLSLWHMTKGASLSKSDYSIELLEEGAEVSLEGGALVGGERRHQVNVLVHHKAPHTKSHQHFKHVVKKGGKTSFQGKIFVDPIAQKTVAYQRNNNLLLEEGAHAVSKPGLEIFADDVKASHGATVTETQEEELFYITSRGISREEAQKMLAFGFLEGLLKNIPLKEARNFARRHYVL